MKRIYTDLLQQLPKSNEETQHIDYKLLVEQESTNKVPLLALNRNLLYYLRKQEAQKKGKYM